MNCECVLFTISPWKERTKIFVTCHDNEKWVWMLDYVKEIWRGEWSQDRRKEFYSWVNLWLLIKNYVKDWERVLYKSIKKIQQMENMFIKLFLTMDKFSGPNGQLMTRAWVSNGGNRMKEMKRLYGWIEWFPTQDCWERLGWSSKGILQIVKK